jgi:hypothetical protein
VDSFSITICCETENPERLSAPVARSPPNDQAAQKRAIRNTLMRIAEAIPQRADACVGFLRSQLRASPCTSNTRKSQMMFPLSAKKTEVFEMEER